MKIPYVPDGKRLMRSGDGGRFRRGAQTRARFLGGNARQGGPDRGARSSVCNNVWRALLLQNFVLADGPRFTYSSGLRYNDSTYPQENGFAAHVFAMYGFGDYADALQPWFVDMSVTPDGAGRKYQNRRAMVLHHLLENYRLTGKTDLFDRFKADYYRVADEIVADRRGTMTTGERAALYWGLLPPDKPGVDVQASTQTVYVLGHNITNCQGLAGLRPFPGRDRNRSRRAGERISARGRGFSQDADERDGARGDSRSGPSAVSSICRRCYSAQTPDYGPEPYDDLASADCRRPISITGWTWSSTTTSSIRTMTVGQWLADYLPAAERIRARAYARAAARGTYGNVNTVYDGGYLQLPSASGDR